MSKVHPAPAPATEVDSDVTSSTFAASPEARRPEPPQGNGRAEASTVQWPQPKGAIGDGGSPPPQRRPGDESSKGMKRVASFSAVDRNSRGRRSSQMLVEITQGSFKGADDRTLMGLTPKTGRTVSRKHHDTQEKTRRRLVVDVLRRFPAHLAYENAYAFFPLITALVPVILGGLLANQLKDELPSAIGEYDKFAEYTDGHSTTVMVLSFCQAIANPVGLYGMPTALIYTLWSWKALLKPVLLPLMLPGFLLSCAFGITNVALLYNGIVTLERISFFVQVALVIIFLGMALFRTGHVVKNGLFGWLAVPVLVVALAVVAAYNLMFAELLVMPNAMKAGFVAVVNPIVFEVIIVALRFVARSHRHNHPLTSCMTVAMAMTLKKMYGRYVAATITEPAYVALCAVWLGLMEYLSVTTLPQRDKFFYMRVGNAGKMCCGATNELDPYAQLKHKRNRELRVHNAVMETSLEFVFCWTGVLMVIWYDVSADGEPVNKANVIINGALQYVVEMFVDLACIMHLTVLQKEPYLDYANSRFRGWSFTTGMLTFFASGYCVVNTMPKLLCRLPGWHSSTWVYCDRAFDRAVENLTNATGLLR